ncbi:MAG TPA: hypothetical protein VGO11_05255 [Chthoniobacteraceae bacterium]|jgi:hypothetical protein|nr:hypothetical protein [Chthoniobacteraceae bacterium]
MKKALSFLAPLLFLSFTGMAKRPDFIVRFFVEANSQDTERFSTTVQLKYPPRSAYIERVPVVSERNIKGIIPFSAPDHSWGCGFLLNPEGRLALQTASMENRGRSIVAFIGTKKGTHQVIDMIIDRPIGDGIITIQKGMSIGEIEALGQRYPNLGRKGGKGPIPPPDGGFMGEPKKPSGGMPTP